MDINFNFHNKDWNVIFNREIILQKMYGTQCVFRPCHVYELDVHILNSINF